MKIVIGYDESAGAQTVIRDLQRAGLPATCDVTVVTALEDLASLSDRNFSAPRSPDVADTYQIDTTRLLEQACNTAKRGQDLVQQVFPSWNVQAKSQVGSAQSVLIREADAENADMVVIGSKGHSLIGRIAFGSTSHYVVNHARCSVRVARPHSQASDDGPVRLLVGVDGSNYAMQAVREVARRNWPAGSEVRVVSAFDFGLYETGVAYEESHADLRKALVEACNAIRDAGLTCTSIMPPGIPRTVLVREAADWNADCLFVGAVGHSLLDRLLIGSTSAAVAAEAPCTVEIVRSNSPA